MVNIVSEAWNAFPWARDPTNKVNKIYIACNDTIVGYDI